MIVDTSAIMAVVLAEPDADRFADALATSGYNAMSAGSFVELGLVLAHRDDASIEEAAAALLQTARIEIAPVTATLARLGWRAYREYGRAAKHPARLNFGDCFAYALAQETGEPLLFKGDDFGHTDVTPALR